MGGQSTIQFNYLSQGTKFIVEKPDRYVGVQHEQ